MIPNASGKLDPDGKPYRYYTCGYAHKERSDAKCPVRHVSANALETAVNGFLGACSQHADVLAATVASARERRQIDRAPLRVRLTEAERALDAVTGQLRNCAKLLVLGNVTALDDVLREQAETLQAEKQRVLVEREQVRLELAECERGEIDSDRIREALGKLGELLPSLTQSEQRDLIMLILERVEVRLGDKPAEKLAPGTRLLELRLKLRVGRLVEGMAERLVIEERTVRAVSAAPGRPLVLTLNVALAPTSGSAKSVTLLTPFRCELGVTRRAPMPKPAAAPVQNPIHRASAWQRCLESDPTLSRLKLAVEEGLSPGSITHHMKLLQLAGEIQTQLLNLTAAEEVRCYGLNQLSWPVCVDGPVVPVDQSPTGIEDCHRGKRCCEFGQNRVR